MIHTLSVSPVFSARVIAESSLFPDNVNFLLDAVLVTVISHCECSWSLAWASHLSIITSLFH